MSEYPQRPPFFANRFVRLMTKVVVANELGPDVFTLLTVIAFQEDAKRYRSAVNYYNGQLAPLIGKKSVDALADCRCRAVAAGWLNYTPGTRTKPASYFVLVPPQFNLDDDSPCDENPDELTARSTANLRQFARSSSHEPLEVPQICGSSPGVGAEPPSYAFPSIHKNGLSALSDLPSKDKKPRPKKPSTKEPESFARFWSNYPRKEKRSVALAAWTKINPSPELVETILADVKRRSTSSAWLESNGKFVPHPSSYLNQRRWEDEAPAPPARKPDFVYDDLNPPSYPPMQFAKRREPK